MTENNNGKEEQKANCPFINSSCTGKGCALYIEMKRVTAGLQQTFGMCSIPAMVQILSEMNMKAQQPQQKIQIPNLMRSQHGN